ncbi:MAG TPA: hypothetical protein VGN11_11180, partial [Candidatus Baltobacteraceae bacterium]|nr:hypothetical protein [Candidatus Baltobacteraceae bacterium]
ARILLAAAGVAAEDRVNEAAGVVRSALNAIHLDAIAMLDGVGGIALLLPFVDAPHYEAVRDWLHRFVAHLAIQRGDLFTTEPNTAGTNLVHLHVSHNAPGSFSALPYSARGKAHLPVCLPVTWDELDAIPNGNVTIDTLPERIQAKGDTFALERKRIGTQSFAPIAKDAAAGTRLLAPSQNGAAGHGHVIAAAMQVLSDGMPRDAAQIVHDAAASGLLPSTFDKKYVYTALIEYIARAQGNGRKPRIVQGADRSFEINEPLDDWPNPPPIAVPAITTSTQALIDRLATTASGSDPAAFEVAVCDAFAHLGFAATHVGGNKAPDGYADAQLGPLAYRIMIECKTAKGDVAQPDAFEAAKYRDPYNAQYCTLIGPAFPDETELTQELRIHGVSAWTATDLQTALAVAADPYELRPLFNPGYAADGLADLLWDRAHGTRKRIRVVADLIARVGWELQVTSAREASSENAAHLTIDAAMALVDEALAQQGSRQACTREEIQLAFEHLTNPITRQAVWLDDTHDAISIIRHVEDSQRDAH